jgi:hypothetical protein
VKLRKKEEKEKERKGKKIEPNKSTGRDGGLTVNKTST